MKIIAILSGLIVVTPFLGIPNSWKMTLVVIFGLIIFTKSFLSYRASRNSIPNSTFKQNEYKEILPDENSITESDNQGFENSSSKSSSIEEREKNNFEKSIENEG